VDQYTKRCPRCDQTKPWDEYYIDRRRQRPGPYCKPCINSYNRARYVAKAVTHASACKECGARIHPPVRASRPVQFCGTACRQAWHNAQQTREYRRDSQLRSTFGISLEEYDRILQAQGGHCRLCDATEAEAKNGVLDVDHDHASGLVRGLLCHRCNWGLGILQDDPLLLRRAADYLEGLINGDS
jgi:hypothetical protein